LIDRYVEQEEALEKGKKTVAIEIEFGIKELQREKEKSSRGECRLVGLGG